MFIVKFNIKKIIIQNNLIIENENNIIQHMNEDHRETITSTLYNQHQINDKNAKMLFLTIDGYYVKSKQNLFFIFFEEPVLNMKNYREALVNQAKKYRSFEM